MSDENVDGELWKKDVRRLMRRRLISRYGEDVSKERSLREVVEKVRRAEMERRVPELVDELASREVVVDERYARVAESLSEKLREEFAEVESLGVVLLGSPIHGGSQVRKALGDESSSDLDWGIVFMDGAVEPKVRTRMREFGDLIIPVLGEKFGLSGLSGCDHVNPDEMWVESFEDVDDARERLARSVGSITGWDETVMFLEPSYPAEINIRNRELMLEGLKKIGEESEELWSDLVEEIYDGWYEVHYLKQSILRRMVV